MSISSGSAPYRHASQNQHVDQVVIEEKGLKTDKAKAMQTGRDYSRNLPANVILGLDVARANAFLGSATLQRDV
jgi:hypothetical protein